MCSVNCFNADSITPYFSFICWCYCVLQILILDEATASVDPKTEDAVLSTVRKEFQHCTILTIVHRLSAVTTYDRILVMKKGQVWFFHAYWYCSELSSAAIKGEEMGKCRGNRATGLGTVLYVVCRVVRMCFYFTTKCLNFFLVGPCNMWHP